LEPLGATQVPERFNAECFLVLSESLPDVGRVVPGEAVARVVLLVGLPRDGPGLELVHDVGLSKVVHAVGGDAVGGAPDHGDVVGLEGRVKHWVRLVVCCLRIDGRC
jgi:hypothetical protein